MSSDGTEGMEAPIEAPEAATVGVIPPAEDDPPDPGSEGRSRPRRAAWLIAAVALGALAALSCILLAVPAWGEGAGPWVTVVLALGSIGAGIVELEHRRGRSGWAVSAVAVAAVAGVVATAGALAQPDLAVHVYGYKDCLMLTGTPPEGIDPESFMTAFYAPSLVGVDTTVEPSLAYGTPITVAASADTESTDLATFTAGAVVDVTTSARSSPEHGVYLAVPVTVEAVNEGALDCFDFHAPPSYWFTYSGDATPYTIVSIPGYPTIDDGGIDNGDGTLTYYDIFDVTPQAAADGGYELDMLEPDGTIKPVFWEEG
jgi:hypothetical protein